MHSRILTGGLLALGLSLTPAVASAATTTTTTTPMTKTTVAPTTTRNYEVVGRLDAHRSTAVAELDRIRKDGITGLYVARIGSKTIRYRVEERRLTHAQAVALEGRLHAHGFSARRIRY